VAADHCQLNRAQIVDGQFLKACGHCTGLLKPTDAPFNDVSPAVLPGIEDWWPSSAVTHLVLSFGNDSTYVMSAEPLTDAAMAVCPICGNSFGAPSAMRSVNAHGIKHGFGI
jgi:hypothetical protein